MSTDTKHTQQSAYNDFHLQYIAGTWQKGQDDSVNTDTNPFNGETLVEIQQATDKQLDEAFQAATKAQAEWAKQTPAQRAAVLYKVALYTTNFTEPLSYQDSAFLKLPKFP